MRQTDEAGKKLDHLPDSLPQFMKEVNNRLGESPDIVWREIALGSAPAVILYMDGLGDPIDLLEAIHQDWLFFEGEGEQTPGDRYRVLKERTITMGKVGEAATFSDMMEKLLSGNSILFVDGVGSVLYAGTESLKQRGVEEATSQSVVRGPREGFTEALRENTALVRRRIQNPNLRLEQRKIGEQTNTQVAIMYIEGLCHVDVLEELRRRMDAIELDSVLESNYIEEMIQDQKYSPFPTVYNSERPDVVASALLEGRIAIFVDGTPFVLIVPALFAQFFQSSEDYYQRGDFSSLLRLLRYLCFGIALLTPSFYIAITTFHQEMLPTNLLTSLIGQREGVPFPAFVEALIMEITFEILREAGIRLPKSIGQSVSIVGTLVIGQAAVEAGLVSAAMVIVVSITAIANFALPAFNVGISARMLRFVMMGIAASFGLYGMIIGMIILGLHLSSLESMGVPYMSTFAPFSWRGQKDALLRLSQRTKKKYLRKLKS
ncbi:spore germination protein [Paenibacillus sp. FSL M8-0334]|uniref:Spore germination protein n=1 Tax=Paenibacillus campinasensis TaxID=66347 RepID=A0ABW9SZ00_9BACL|nr:spore germination protein [Paenibacillus campinasensis]MUG65668.1 spore germination protein [Paenibacillus campinasensis]